LLIQLVHGNRRKWKLTVQAANALVASLAVNEQLPEPIRTAHVTALTLGLAASRQRTQVRRARIGGGPLPHHGVDFEDGLQNGKHD
jgi:hypothetical protein